MDNDLKKLRDELARQLIVGELEILHVSADGSVLSADEIDTWSTRCH